MTFYDGYKLSFLFDFVLG